MTFLSMNSPVKRIGPAFIAGAALFFVAAISFAGLHLFGHRFGFGFLPLLVLVAWPKRANTLVSFAIVFLAGLFTDWATGDIRGQWALIFILVWGYLRPEMRSASSTPVGLFLVWLLVCVVAVLSLSFAGYFVYGVRPDLAPMVRQMILATLMLPILMLLRRAVLLRLSESDGWS